MAEREVDIAITESALSIHAFVREVPGAPVVVMVHGITGHANGPDFYNGARALESVGFTSVRFNLYDDDARYRKLIDCTIETHAEDLDTVVGWCRSSFGDVALSVVGHSLGGLTVLSSNKRDFQCAVLWDPTHAMRGDFSARDNAEWVETLDAWRMKWATDVLISGAMERSWKGHRSDELAGALGKPVKVIAAGADDLVPCGRRIFEAAAEPKEFALVEGARHCFYEGETQQQLFGETISWLERFGR